MAHLKAAKIKESNDTFAVLYCTSTRCWLLWNFGGPLDDLWEWPQLLYPRPFSPDAIWCSVHLSEAVCRFPFFATLHSSKSGCAPVYQILSKSVESSLIHDDYRHVQNLKQIEQYATKNLFSIWGPFAIFRFFLPLPRPLFNNFLRDHALTDPGKLKHVC